MERKNKPTLIKPSIIAFTKEARKIPGFTFTEWLHGLFYGRFTYFYIGFGVGEHPLAKFGARLLKKMPLKRAEKQQPAAPDRDTVTFADTYHGKVVPLESARQLVLINEPIQIPDLEQVIPYKKARAIIMQNPDHIIALECPCRSARPNPCLPLDVCLIVGEPFASFVIEHHPTKSRWITPQEAEAILEAEDQRGHVHHAFFKDAMLGRFYAICNCCSCCCGAMNAHRHGTPMLASSGYVAEVDEDLCIGCETCVSFCQFGALSVTDYSSYVNGAACMGCGVCVQHCDQEAISLIRAPERGDPLDLKTLRVSENP